jgi:hypothetical protein
MTGDLYIPDDNKVDEEMILEERLAVLEARMCTLEKQVAELTVDRDRFVNALKGAAEMALANNVASAMLPKEMRTVLKEYVTNGKKA